MIFSLRIILPKDQWMLVKRAPGVVVKERFNIAGRLRDRVACSALDHQGSNFEFCVWRAVSVYSSHHPLREVLLTQFSLYVGKGGLKSHACHMLCNVNILEMWIFMECESPQELTDLILNWLSRLWPYWTHLGFYWRDLDLVFCLWPFWPHFAWSWCAFVEARWQIMTTQIASHKTQPSTVQQN